MRGCCDAVRYYFHIKTRETSWEAPTDRIIALSGVIVDNRTRASTDGQRPSPAATPASISTSSSNMTITSAIILKPPTRQGVSANPVQTDDQPEAVDTADVILTDGFGDTIVRFLLTF